MNAPECEKLRKNFPQLVADVDAKKLRPLLIQKGVLDDDKSLFSFKNDEDAMEFLLETLRKAPSERNAYRNFIDALREFPDDYYTTLADQIEDTQCNADPSVCERVDPSYQNASVRKTLNENFVEIKGAKTSLRDVRNVLDEHEVFGSNPWKDKELQEFVKSHFAGVEIKKEQQSFKNKKSIFYNLGRIKVQQNQQTMLAQAPDPLVKIETLSPQDLRLFLDKEFTKVKLPTNNLDVLEKENISGALFLELTQEDLKELMPSLTFGEKMKLRSIKNESTQSHFEQKVEQLSQFGSTINQGDFYTYGCCVDARVFTRGPKLSTIRNFHLPQLPSDDLREYIIRHSAEFAAACINERRNGTIYFGISPENTSQHEKGKIVGLGLCLYDLVDLDEKICTLFFQKTEVKNAVGNIRFVPVVSDTRKTDLKTLNVIELDVEPKSLNSCRDFVKVDASQIPSLKNEYETRDPVFVFADKGQPCIKPIGEMIANQQIPQETLDKRQDEEIQQKNLPTLDLVSKLKSHLTCGSETMDDEIHTFVFLGPTGKLSCDCNTMSFIKHLQPEVVFDFEYQSSPDGIYAMFEKDQEVFKVVTLNDFDERQKSKENMQNLEKELDESDTINWVFCNGDEEIDQVAAVEWNKTQRPHFKKTLRYYLQKHPKDRVLVIICLFSHNGNLIEACDETLTDLSSQWILLSDNQNASSKWQGMLLNRNRVDRHDLDDRCIVGLPWEQVSRSVVTWCGQLDSLDCQIPHSSGGTVEVSKRKINEWSDIEVVSAQDQFPTLPDEDERQLKERQKKAEKDFYCGKEVQWINFYSNHVCQRDVHNDLIKLVTYALSKRDDEKVQCVYFYHQPGAGGSTSAKEILWTMRKTNRCCVVRKITDQTAQLLIEVARFEDKDPKAILVLIDNEEEDKVLQLQASLEKEVRIDEIFNNLHFVLLICFRSVYVAVDKRKPSIVILKQFLTEKEIFWFEERYKQLTSRYDNPQSLISFNILKTNFDNRHIKETVEKLVEDIKDSNEQIILKYVAMINTFDIDFRRIHVSCFDTILESVSETNIKPRFEKQRCRNSSWEAKVSPSFKILLNLSSNETNKKPRKTIRLFHKLTALQTLEIITSKTKETESELMSILLSKEVFGEDSQGMKFLQGILTNMVKKRACREDNAGKEKFSPLILSIQTKEGSDKAGEIMEQTFKLNGDPYTAQQVSRFYIELKNFKKAEDYARRAVLLVRHNSYLLDTYAQVYKAQLSDKIEAARNSEENWTSEEMNEIIALCICCITHFKKEQDVSEREALENLEVNTAGYHGELESIALILKALKNCNWFISDISLHKFLVEPRFSPPAVDVLSQENKSFLKSLWHRSREALKKLDDNALQIKVEIESNPMSFLNQDHQRKYLNLRASLNRYFGEESNHVPSGLNEREECQYRQRKVFTEGGFTLSDALQKYRNGSLRKLKTSYELLLHNIKSQYSCIEDFNCMLNVVTVLLIDKAIPNGPSFGVVVDWSKEFYRLSQSESTNKRFLESCLYLALYNFPTEERMECLSLAPAHDFEKMLEKWKEYFKTNMRFPRITCKETTVFFLGNGLPMEDIVYQKMLGDFVRKHDENHDNNHENSLWNSPTLCKLLRLMKGVLQPEGNFILYTYHQKSGTRNKITIKTAKKIHHKLWWRKPVFFYLGFSFSGLKAYGITNEDPASLKK